MAKTRPHSLYSHFSFIPFLSFGPVLLAQAWGTDESVSLLSAETAGEFIIVVGKSNRIINCSVGSHKSQKMLSYQKGPGTKEPQCFHRIWETVKMTQISLTTDVMCCCAVTGVIVTCIVSTFPHEWIQLHCKCWCLPTYWNSHSWQWANNSKLTE